MANWNSHWIAYDSDPRQDLGVFVFQNRISLDSIPDSMLVRISADNRYKLLVNGILVSFGPQRGDILHWFYETIDLADHLNQGENEVVAVVWNFGRWSPMAQVSARTGFVLDVVGEPQSPLNTPGAWKVARLDGWDFKMMTSGGGDFYIDVGPGEIVDGRRHPDSFLPAFGDLQWRPPHNVAPPTERGQGYSSPWNLVPRSIPPMRYRLRPRPPVIRHGFDGDPSPGPDAPLSQDLAMPAGNSILLDFDELLCAYPRLKISGDPGTEITLTYAERLWPNSAEAPDAENRSAVSGRKVEGYQDMFILGSGECTFEPLWWRTFRYILIEASDNCVLHYATAVETGYPLRAESAFEADDPTISQIWEVSLRTAERCAGETYFDCPYYEQLQYVGDTRIQALIGYYLGKDRQLQRNAVETLGWSRMSNGLTRSRYPDRQPQVIPPFSLWWVLMRQDQRLYDRVWQSDPDDDDPIDSEGLDVANAYNRLSEAALDRTFWNFADWAPEFPGGTPPGSARATVHLLTLYLAHLATEVNLDLPDRRDPRRVQALAQYIFPQIEKVDGLVRHRQDPDWIACEQSEAVYRLIQQRLGLPVDPWPREALDRAKAARCTYYFSYYKHLTMGASDYLAELAPWREMIENGLTTFAENPPPVRSDCHAWSAHPILGFFQIVAGVTSVGHGWAKTRIAPNPGSLRRFDAHIAHPDGELRVAWDGSGFEIDTPVPGMFEWKGRVQELSAGSHRLG